MMNKNTTTALAFIVLSTLSLCIFEVQPASTETEENSWMIKNAMPTARSGLGVAVVNGKIYAIGGDGGCNITEEYNPITNTWTTKKSMPTGRSRFAIVAYKNKIYVIGGVTANGFTAANEVYDPVTDTWTSKSPLPRGGRAELTASVINGKIYVVGGYYMGLYLVSSSTLEVYDPETDTWTTKTPMLTAVYSCSSAVIDNKMYVVENAFGTHMGGLIQIYDAETDSWSYGRALPFSVVGAVAVATTGIFAPKRVYVLGSSASANSSVQVYNPENDTWSFGAQMPTLRSYLGVAVVEDIIFAIGGRSSSNTSLTVNEQYTPWGYGTMPPVLRIISPESRAYNVSSITLQFTSTKQVSWSGYSLDNAANVTVNETTLLTGLSDGDHSIVVYANDTFGNMGSSNIVYFSVDTIQPVVSVLSPENKVYSVNEIPLNFTTNEPVLWVAYSLDGKANVTISKNITLAGLTEGAHNLTVYAMDMVGNIGASETVQFSVEPFPVILVTAVVTTVIIVVLASYLYIKRRKNSM
ncbi:MAG: kelch repeat-containing protein [Candidatus Bathyarchaeia archaeon]